jgi:hypothetical protein
MSDGRPTEASGAIEDLRDRYVSAVGKTTLEILDEGLTPEKAEELAWAVDRYAEGEIEAWRGRPASPKDVACRAGCSFCCHVPVAITIPEAILIANTLRDDRDEAEMEALRARVERSHRARAGLVGEHRDRVGHPCPLLDEEGGTCSIHEFRPLNCRGWSSTDVSRCESYFNDPTRPASIPIDGVQRTVTQAMVAGMQVGLRSRGLEHSTVDLSAALHILLEDPGAVDRWLDGGPAFLGAEVDGDPRW